MSAARSTACFHLSPSFPHQNIQQTLLFSSQRLSLPLLSHSCDILFQSEFSTIFHRKDLLPEFKVLDKVQDGRIAQCESATSGDVDEDIFSVIHERSVQCSTGDEHMTHDHQIIFLDRSADTGGWWQSLPGCGGEWRLWWDK